MFVTWGCLSCQPNVPRDLPVCGIASTPSDGFKDDACDPAVLTPDMICLVEGAVIREVTPRFWCVLPADHQLRGVRRGSSKDNV